MVRVGGTAAMRWSVTVERAFWLSGGVHPGKTTNRASPEIVRTFVGYLRLGFI
jgi:hypothetical protein